MPWSYSAQITCRALGFHVYSLHHIFTTGAKYDGIDVLYYSLDQSSTDSTAHSGAQTQKQIWHMQCQQRDIISLWCIQKRLYSLCATACSLSLVFLLLCRNCGWACRTVQSTCLATTKKYRNGKKVIRGRWESICIYFAAFVCETSSFIFIWFSLVTKAPSALLSTCTEQQGIMYAQKTGAVWSINTKVTHFKSARRQAGSVPYHIRANVSVPGFCLWQWLVPDALQRKAKTVEVDKAISVQHWELIAEDWPNPWTLCLALFPNYLH